MPRPLRSLALALACTAVAPLALAQAADPKAKPADKSAKPDAKAKPAPVVGRDWTQIDTNKDGYVSPDEMEVWLKANPGPAK